MLIKTNENSENALPHWYLMKKLCYNYHEVLSNIGPSKYFTYLVLKIVKY